VLLHTKGDLAAAETLYREALVARLATLGDRHPGTLQSISNLGALMLGKGNLNAASSAAPRGGGEAQAAQNPR
jgi:hypothetical protein